MTIEEYIEKGKALIADYQWAMVCMDHKLMDKFSAEKTRLDIEVMSKGEDFYIEYYWGLYGTEAPES